MILEVFLEVFKCLMVIGIFCVIVAILIVLFFIFLLLFVCYYDYYTEKSLFTISKLRRKSLYCEDFK